MFEWSLFIGGTQRAIEDSQKLPLPFGGPPLSSKDSNPGCFTNSKTKNLPKILYGACMQLSELSNSPSGFGVRNLSNVIYKPGTFI